MIAIVLVHPEIPPNTGNVIRLAANTGAALHLVEPLGFTLGDRELKRAGLDYHEYARLVVHPSYAARAGRRSTVRGRGAGSRSPRARRARSPTSPSATTTSSCSAARPPACPRTCSPTFPDDARVRIPMVAGRRSLNLSNAVAVAVYEAWRQGGYAPMRQDD